MVEKDDPKTRFKDDRPELEFLTTQPENAQVANYSQYEKFLTSNEAFFIRNHYSTPAIDEGKWELSITGLVDEEVTLSLNELKESFPTESVVNVLECSGDGRTAFKPDADGHQWSFGAISTARWTGIPLSALLKAAGAVTNDDLWLTVIGADAPKSEPIFARSLPMSKVLDDCLLAYEMNGELLPAEHGFPARLIVPGWYGNNSVKWVRRLNVMETMMHGEEWKQYSKWHQQRYRILPKGEEPIEYENVDVFDTQDQMEADAIRHPYLFDKLVNSLIIKPTKGVITPTDRTVTITGIAWAGDDIVTRVEVSTDGGETWTDAELVGQEGGQFTWQRFRYDWNASPGDHMLVSRATDDRGRGQPATISDPDEKLLQITDAKFPWNQRGYGNNAYMTRSVDVTVET